MIKIKVKKKPSGAVVLVMNSDREILLLKRAPESLFAPDRWGFPGGKIEEGETPLRAAKRETREETQLRLRDSRPLGIFDNVVVAFFSDDFEGDVEIDFEHTDWKWVPQDQLSSYDLAPSVWEIFKKVKDGGH